MAFAPPRKPGQGRGIPVMKKTSSIIRESSSGTTITKRTSITTLMPRSATSSAKQTACGSDTPCSSQSGIARPRSRGEYQAKTPGYGRTPRATPSSGRGRALANPPVETVTSVSSTTIGPDGRQTVIHKETRVIGSIRAPKTPASRALGAPVQGSRLPAPRGTSAPTGLPQGSRLLAPRGYSALPRAPQGTCPETPCSAPAPPSAPRGIRPPSAAYRAPARAPAQTPARAPARTPRAPPTQGIPSRSQMPGTARTERAIPRPASYGSARRSLAPPPASVSASSVTSTVSTGAIPKVRTVTEASKTSVKGAKKTTVTQQVTKLAPQAPPEGRYAMSLKHAPHKKEARLAQFSSPPGIRRRMDEHMPKALKAAMMPPEYKGIQDIRKLTALGPYKDTVSCAMDLTHGRAPAPPGYYADAHEMSFLDRSVEPEYGSPYASRTSPRAASPGAPRSPLGEPHRPTVLEQEVEQQLYDAASRSPRKLVQASGSRKSPAKLPMIMTDQGPVQATEQVLTERRVEKSPGAEKVSRHITSIEKSGCGAIQTELDTQQLGPGGLPKRGDTAMENISITSSTAIAPGGIKESTTTVIYETTKPPGKGDKIGLSPKQVEQLVEEEATDVNKTMKLKPIDLKVFSPKSYGIRKREHELKLNYTSVLELEQSLMIPEPSPDHEQEEVQPEMMATIMHSEEQGLPLGSMPAQMYDTLFPEKHQTPMITVNSAAPAPLQDVLVPNQLPENFHSAAASADISAAASHTEYTGAKPTGNAFSENNEKPRAKNVARRGNKRKLTDVPLLSKEMPPWAVEDMQPIMELVGAPLNSSLTVESLDAKDQETPEQAADQSSLGIECMLQLEPPTHASRVQLRGSTRPSWFPGYYVALPELPDLIKVEKIPDNVLNSAWRAVQPNFFPDDSIITV